MDSNSKTKANTLFVLGTLTVFTLAALAFVLRFGVDIPFFDEWDAIVPGLSGAQPITVAWLWSQHNDHRLVIPRLLEIGLLKATGYEYRVPMALNVLLFAYSAAVLIRLAARLRGRVRCTDAVFPILLLHFANYENLLWAVQLQVTLTEACIVTLLYLVFTVSHGREMSPGKAGIAGLCLIVPPLCGAYGLPFTVIGSLWLCVRSIAAFRAGNRRSGILGSAGSIAGMTLAGVYLIGFHRHSASTDASGGFSPVSFVRTIVEYMMTALGRGAALSGVRLTPAEGYAAPYHASLLMVTGGLAMSAAAAFVFCSPNASIKRRRLVIAVVCLPITLLLLWFLSTRFLIPPATALIVFPALITPAFALLMAFIIIRCWRSQPELRGAMLGPLAFVTALAALTVSVGIGRSSFGPGAALAGRYTAHSCLLLVCAYLFAEKYGSPRQRRLVPIALFAAAVAFLPNNIEEGIVRAGIWHQGLQNFYRAADSGASVSALASSGAPVAHHRGVAVVHPTAAILERGIEQLRAADVRPFKQVRDDPRTRALFLSPNTAQKSPEGTLIWNFPKPISVFGIEMDYETASDSGAAPPSAETGSVGIGYIAEAIPAISTSASPPAPAAPAGIPSALLPSSGSLRFYPNRVIVGLRILPDPQSAHSPARLSVHRVTLMVPLDPSGTAE